MNDFIIKYGAHASVFSLLITLVILLFNFFGTKKTWMQLSKKGKTIVILIAIILAIVSAFFIGIKLKKCNNEKTRIVVILPLNNELGAAWDDGVRQILGITSFLRDNPDFSKKYEFTFIDHGMSNNIDDLLFKIKEEALNGTKIFISTMSKICEPLSKRFESTVSNVIGAKPILICTVASSPEVKVSKNSNVFRFYIRSNEEGETLANFGITKGYKQASFIRVQDFYGNGAVTKFEEFWIKDDRSMAGGIYVNSTDSYETVLKSIKAKKILLMQTDVIFVAHYGSGIDNVFTALAELKIDVPILVTSPIIVPAWQEPIKEILDTITWVSCKPVYKNKDITKYEKFDWDDIINGFTYLTLDKVIHTVEIANGNIDNFSKHWIEDYPKIIDHTYDPNGDAVINLEVYIGN